MSDDEPGVETDAHSSAMVNGPGVLGLVGPSSEVVVKLEGRSCQALWDTGSMVSTVTYSLSKQLKLPIHPMDHLIRVEGVGGHLLQYSGYVIAKVQMPDIDQEVEAMFLVVPDIGYNCATPVLIGTNILQHLHRSDCVTYEYPWGSVLKCMSAQVKNINVPAKATKAYTVPGESGLYKDGMVHAPLFCGRVTVVAEAPDSPLGGSVVVTPSVQYLSPGTSRVCIEVKNYGKQPVHIPAKTVLCTLQQTTVVSPDDLKSDDSSIPLLDQFDWEDMSVRLTGLQLDVAKELVKKYDIAFSLHDLDLGRCSKTKHRIPMVDPSNFKLPYHRIPPSMYKHLQEMLALDAIRVSQSPYASPVVLIRKPNGKIRFCIDFRKLNSRTKKDAYALPRISEMFDSLHGAKWFSCLDIKSAYWQVGVEEEDKEKTAFTVGPLGFYECNRMPFGLSNAPATFQRLMENCFGDMNMQSCLIYLDDIVFFPELLMNMYSASQWCLNAWLMQGWSFPLRNVSCFRTESNTLAISCLQMVFPLTQRRSGVFRNGLCHRTSVSFRVSWVLWDTIVDSLRTFPRLAALYMSCWKVLVATKRSKGANHLWLPKSLYGRNSSNWLLTS